MRDEFRKLARYSAVGLLNTAIGYAVILAAMRLGLSALAANGVGYACGLAVSYGLNTRWTFATTTSRPSAPVAFLLAFAVAYGANLGVLMIALRADMAPALAQALAVVCYQVGFFLLLRVFVFSREADSVANERAGLPVTNGRSPLLHVALVAAAIAPFVPGGAAVGLIDLPNAIGRIGIGLRLMGHPDASRFYALTLKLIPNMAVDSFGLAFGGLLGPEAAVNLFVAFSIATFYGGVQALRIALYGRGSVAIGALSIFAIYSLSLRWGFINYIFASGLMIFAVGRLEREMRSPSTLFAVGQAALLALTFLSSIFPVLLYVIYAAVRLSPRFIGAVRQGDFAAAVRLILVHGLGPALVGVLFLLGQVAPPWQQGTNWIWPYKPGALAALFWFADEPFEIALAALVVAAGAAMLWIRGARVPWPQALPLLVLAATFVAMPFNLKGVAFADTRLPGTIVGLALGAVRLRPLDMAVPCWGRAVLLTVLLAGLLKPGAVYIQLRPVIEAARTLPQLFEGVPEGSVIAAVSAGDAEIGGNVTWHLPLIQLVRGDYFFPAIFENYFIDFKPGRPATPSDDLLSNTSEAPKALLCWQLTHTVVTGTAETWASTLPVEMMHRAGKLAMFRIRHNVPPPPC